MYSIIEEWGDVGHLNLVDDRLHQTQLMSLTHHSCFMSIDFFS